MKSKCLEILIRKYILIRFHISNNVLKHRWWWQINHTMWARKWDQIWSKDRRLTLQWELMIWPSTTRLELFRLSLRIQNKQVTNEEDRWLSKLTIQISLLKPYLHSLLCLSWTKSHFRINLKKRRTSIISESA